jgi:hypothetical protein
LSRKQKWVFWRMDGSNGILSPYLLDFISDAELHKL